MEPTQTETDYTLLSIQGINLNFRTTIMQIARECSTEMIVAAAGILEDLENLEAFYVADTIMRSFDKARAGGIKQ